MPSILPIKAPAMAEYPNPSYVGWDTIRARFIWNASFSMFNLLGTSSADVPRVRRLLDTHDRYLRGEDVYTPATASNFAVDANGLAKPLAPNNATLWHYFWVQRSMVNTSTGLTLPWYLRESFHTNFTSPLLLAVAASMSGPFVLPLAYSGFLAYRNLIKRVHAYEADHPRFDGVPKSSNFGRGFFDLNASTQNKGYLTTGEILTIPLLSHRLAYFFFNSRLFANVRPQPRSLGIHGSILFASVAYATIKTRKEAWQDGGLPVYVKASDLLKKGTVTVASQAQANCDTCDLPIGLSTRALVQNTRMAIMGGFAGLFLIMASALRQPGVTAGRALRTGALRAVIAGVIYQPLVASLLPEESSISTSSLRNDPRPLINPENPEEALARSVEDPYRTASMMGVDQVHYRNRLYIL
ncbi:hypothetical protein, variant [Fonticula alba]|uniref:Uncharacterized protein n=1 Tax=Fonticula alba TaxID=691883 RepID=A0A058ZBH4_FONAL|nr:hypothetical protein, variant [Fonticula alba]KCV70777.1 hypothetical protein, variant [Fonticula alba]|eukprot:XP_009495293.1 hypothetical protein, variant [Fonticula alba]